jgi:hypothetical protein
MNLVESVSARMTPAPKKARKVPGFWNWPELIAMAEKAVETGEVQQGKFQGIYFAIVTPEHGIVKSAQTPEYLALHEKCRVTLYSMYFTLDVEKGETIPHVVAK